MKVEILNPVLLAQEVTHYYVRALVLCTKCQTKIQVLNRHAVQTATLVPSPNSQLPKSTAWLSDLLKVAVSKQRWKDKNPVPLTQKGPH